MIPTVNAKTFHSICQSGTVLAEFYADWCMECHMLLPYLEQAANQSEVAVLRINCDTDRALAEAYGVMSLPTLLLLENGKEKSRLCGLRETQEILNFISRN